MGKRREPELRIGALAVIIVAGMLSLIVVASVVPPTRDVRGATTWTVDISAFAFHPPTLQILIGDTVIWTNNDGTPHTVTSTGGQTELDSGSLLDGETYTHTFNSAGMFTYRCELHPSMTGSVAVDTVIPEFSNLPFVMLGILAVVLGLIVVRRKT